MESGRLFEILYYLMENKQTTAKQLADKFEVSTRTIYRDLDKLLVAGIPIITKQGVDGGVSLDENFVFDKSLLDESQQEQILLALSSLSSLHVSEYQELLKHMQTIFQKESEEWLDVNFSSWHQDQEMNEKFSQLKDAILKHLRITFHYINAQGQKSHRDVFPIKLFYKNNAWYLYGYEVKKADYRTYKLTRIQQLVIKDEQFDRSAFYKEPHLTYEENQTKIDVVLKFQKYLGSFVYDQFSDQDIQEKEDGYWIHTSMPYHPWFLSFLLSFGSGVEIIEPHSLREEMLHEIHTLLKIYG
ncbi:MAG: YafY family protein [Longibaculum muris]|uniref:Putative DNA-binding transcriptional regulator YafY n=1 Tax=Longibaculum muris TaxID=1796628 RepID=A0A4R3Z7K9_9FIRM|nr:YafY family protein [Longibaculum muris]KXU50511.1 HTH domain protein [Candidatus Stoquefichus sp. KLE1796]MBS5371310.1 YafY family transcriptional regulator [Coprobacillus cateniformis]MCR1887274.1 YafY family transcriptional regulator [Longibaculum muris]MED9812345.1 YafY family protein [Longibaculum muris]TCW02152.1 putative DNA-binding transcriptional regulator YafY [Longibaculum muris]